MLPVSIPCCKSIALFFPPHRRRTSLWNNKITYGKRFDVGLDDRYIGTGADFFSLEVSAIAEHTTCTVGELQRFSILVDHLITECSYVLDGEENTTPLLIK